LGIEDLAMGTREIGDRAFNLGHTRTAVPASGEVNPHFLGATRGKFTIRSQQQVLIGRVRIRQSSLDLARDRFEVAQILIATSIFVCIGHTLSPVRANQPRERSR
jgi:hypothetical protein